MPERRGRERQHGADLERPPGREPEEPEVERVPEQVDPGPDRHRPRGSPPERVGRVVHDGVEPARHQDHAGHQHQVGDREGEQADPHHPVGIVALDPHDRVGGPVLVAEVHPPQERDQHHREQHGEQRLGLGDPSLGADAHRDHGLAERDDQQQPVTFGEVLGPQREARLAARGHRDDEAEHGREPGHPPQVLGQRHGDEQAGGRGEVHRRDADDGAGRAAHGRAQERRCVDQHDHQVDDREEQCVRAERLRHRDRQQEERRHRHQHRQPGRDRRRADVVGQPAVAVVHPPDHAQQAGGLEVVAGAARVGDGGGDLGDGEDEHEVEEQLEHRDRSGVVRAVDPSGRAQAVHAADSSRAASPRAAITTVWTSSAGRGLDRLTERERGSTRGARPNGERGTTDERAARPTRRLAHRARLAPYVEPHLARRRAGEKHPVHDFLFTYYSFSPAKLLDWQPGWPASGQRRPAGATPRPRRHHARPAAGNGRASADVRLLRAARVGDGAPRRTRPGIRCRCGWAPPAPTRSWSRTGSPARTSTPSASSPRRRVPLNRLRPGRDDRPAYEQPGCLHATMDLYKHAFRLWPLVGSDLVADCFELAWDVRIVDMRAAPYDLTPPGASSRSGSRRPRASRSTPLASAPSPSEPPDPGSADRRVRAPGRE